MNSEPSTEPGSEKEQYLLRDECYKIRGAIFAVYGTIGCGFLEAVYQECLELEFTRRGIPFRSQAEFIISYKGEPLRQTYKADFVCFDQVIVEIKACRELASEHKAQVINYLQATKLRVGLLVNFGHCPDVEIERIIV